MNPSEASAPRTIGWKSAIEGDKKPREFNEASRKFVVNNNDKVQRFRETPLTTEKANLRSHEPHLSVTISGPSTISLSAKTYKFSAQMHYVAGQDHQPVTLQHGGAPGTGWNEDEAYLFYDDRGNVPKHEFLEINYDDEPRAVRTEHGFVTLRVGETAEQEIEIWLSCWKQGLQVGQVYELRMPWAHIGWWEYGTMEV